MADAKVDDWAVPFLEALGATTDSDPEAVGEIPDDVIGPIIAKLTRKTADGETVEIRPLDMGKLRLFIKKVRGGEPKAQEVAVTVTKKEADKTDDRPKKRLSDVLDQMDDTPFEPLTESERLMYHKNYVDITGGEPGLECKASSDQIAALKAKMDAGNAPYADFAVFVPHGKRFAKIRKFDAQVFVHNTLQQRVMRGPANFTSWLDSWMVFRTAMLSLKAASPQVLDDYSRGLRNLCQIHPEAWGLIYAADEIMRGEVWDDMRDELLNESRWPEACPWNEVIKLSTFGSGDAKRNHWWFLHVQAPAQRGGKDLVKTLDGTSLLPSPDGLFGISASSSAGGAATDTSTRGRNKGAGARANRRTRAYRDEGPQNQNGNQNFGGGKGSYQPVAWNGGTNGKGKDWTAKGKHKSSKGQSKGKKGGKESTK